MANQDNVDSLQEYYSDLEDLFDKPGWKHFLQEMKNADEMIRSLMLTDADMSDTDSNVWNYRGKLTVFESVLLWEALQKQHKEDFEEDVAEGTFLGEEEEDDEEDF